MEEDSTERCGPKSRSNSNIVLQKGSRRRDSEESRSRRSSRSQQHTMSGLHPGIDITLPLSMFLDSMQDHVNPRGRNAASLSNLGLIEEYTGAQSLPRPIPALGPPAQITLDQFPPLSANAETSLLVEIPDGLKVISCENHSLLREGGAKEPYNKYSAQIQSWCDLIKYCQTYPFEVKSHTLSLSRRILGSTGVDQNTFQLGGPSVLNVAVSVDKQMVDSSTFLHKCEITHLCFGFNDIIMWNDDSRRWTKTIEKFVEWIKILRSVSEQFESVQLLFENVTSACLFVENIFNLNLFPLVSSIVSTISIVSDTSCSLVEQLLATKTPVPSDLTPNFCVSRCGMLRDILNSGNKVAENQGRTLTFDQSLNSAKIWRQAVGFQNMIILDVKFYSRSEEFLEILQVNVYDSVGSMLCQLSALPKAFQNEALAKELGYSESNGRYSYNGEAVMTPKVLLQTLVLYLNDLTAKRNIVLCTYSSEVVLAPLLNNMETKGLFRNLKRDGLAFLDLVSLLGLKPVGELINQNESQSDKDIILQALKASWENNANHVKACIQPLHLTSISFSPDILFLDWHNIKQILTKNRTLIQVQTQDCDDFKYFLPSPMIDPDWRVESVQHNRQCIQIKMVSKKSLGVSRVNSIGCLLSSSHGRLTLANFRVIAHLLGPNKSHSFRSLALWNKFAPVIELQNLIYPHILGHTDARKTMKDLSFSGSMPSKYEVFILSLGYINEKVSQFSILNVSNGNHLSISNQYHNVEQELVNQLGRGVPKIVIGHNVMEMLDVVPNASQVIGVVELEWLLLPPQRQKFLTQPSWSDIVGKVLSFDFQFVPAEATDMSFYSLEFLRNLPHLPLDELTHNVRRFMLSCSFCAQNRPRDSNMFLVTQSKEPESRPSAPSTIAVRPLEDLRQDESNSERPSSPVFVDSDSDENEELSICSERKSRTKRNPNKVGYLSFNLLILNLKTTTTENTSFVSAIEAYMPSQNKSFHEMILPEEISQEILIKSGYSWNGKSWKLEQEGSINQVINESECLQKLNHFVEADFGPNEQFVLVVPCVKTFGRFLIMLKRHNRLKNFFLACRGWLDVKCLVYLWVLSPRKYFVKAMDLEKTELFQLYEYMGMRSLGHLKHVPNVIGKILKTLKDFNFYDEALPISLHVKPYNLVYVNARTLKYSIDRQYECLSVIYAKNIANGETFHCAIAPYGVWDPNLVQELGYKQNSETWILEHEGKTLPCLSLMDGMINFLRFACANTDQNMKTILVCSVFKESVAHLFEVVEFMKANCIFFEEIIAIFDFATFLSLEKKYHFITTEAVLHHYKTKIQSDETLSPQLGLASDIAGQSEEILECLAMQAQECSIGIQDMIAKNAHGWNSPTWNKLLKESHVLMFQDHVFPLELAATVSLPENSPKLVPCQVAQPVVSFSDKLYTTLPHPMTNIIVHERIEMSPDRPLDLKISCHGNHKELKKGSIIGLICRQDKYQHYMQDLENSLEAVNHERLNVRKSNSRERLQDDNYLISDTMEQKPDIAFLNQSMIESTKKTKKNLPSEENPGKKQCSKKNNYEEVENPKNITVSSTFAPIEKEVEASLSIGAKQNGEDPTSKCVKGKPLSPLSAQEMEEMGIASSSEDHQDLGKVLDTFMATKGEEDKVQTNIERSEDPFSLDELQDKFIALNEHPSFTPLMLAYMKWCSVNKKDVDGCIGDTFIVHLVAMGCTTYDYLKEMFSKVDPWNESQIRISLAEKYTSMETLWSNNGLMDILSWMIWHVFSPINSCNSPLQSEGDLNLNVESESREQPTSTQIVETSQVLVPPRSPECQDFELNGTQSESNTETSSNPPIIRSSSALPTLLLEKKCSEVEKKKQSPEGSDLQDKMKSLKERSSANSVSTFSTSSSENSVTNDTNSIATDEVTETTKADLKKVSMEAEQEGSGLEFSSENEKSDQTSTTSSSNEDWDKGPSKTISDIKKPPPKSSKVGLTTNEESSNDPVTKTLDQLPDEKGYKHLPFDIEKLWKSISYGKITSVSGDIVAITAYPSRIVGTSKNEEKARGKILFQSSEVLDKLIGQTAITFPNEKRERIAVFTSILQNSDQMHWGFIAALDSYKRVVQVGFYYDEALHYTETPYDRVLGSFGHFVVHSCCLVHVNGPVNEAKSLENVVIFVNPTPCLAIVKQLQVRKTSKDLLESFFHEAKFEHINKDKYFCIMSSPLKVLDANDLNRKFVKLLTVDQDPQNVKTHCKTIAPQNPILVFFRPGRFLVLSDQLSDERLVVETIEKMSPSTNTPDEKSNCLVFWHIYPPSSGDVTTNDASQSLVEFQDGDPQGPNTSAGEPQVNEYVTNNLCSYHSHLKTKLCRNSILRKCPRSDEECYFAHNISAYIKPREYCRYFIQGYCWRGNCPFPHKTVQNLYMAYKAKVKNMIKQCKNCEKVKPNKPKSPTPTRYPTRSSRKRSLPRDSSYEPSSKTQPQMPDFF